VEVTARESQHKKVFKTMEHDTGNSLEANKLKRCAGSEGQSTQRLKRRIVPELVAASVTNRDLLRSAPDSNGEIDQPS